MPPPAALAAAHPRFPRFLPALFAGAFAVSAHHVMDHIDMKPPWQHWMAAFRTESRHFTGQILNSGPQSG